MDILWQNVKDATRSVTVVRTLKRLVALIVIVLITGAYGTLKAHQVNKIELTKTRLINQMDKVNWNFISELEGKAVDTAYVPSDNSGVTIGTGVDLKMKNAEFLETLKVPNDIIEVLEPYFGLKGDEAKKYIKDNPLVLSAVDVKILDESIQKYHANKIKSDYEKDSGKSWSELTSNQQTVITSVGFQYGNMKHKTPNFWNGVISNDWNKVTNELNDFGDKYSTRRKKEAKLLNSKI